MLERDGHQCTDIEHGQRCTAVASDADHLVAGDDHSLGNLTAKCSWHHGRKSAAEGGRAAAARRAHTKIATESHPSERLAR